MKISWPSLPNISNEASIAIALACLYLLLTPLVAFAGTQQVRTNIYATMTDERFGGCMAQVKVPYQLNCPTDVNGRSWVTFGCTGQFGDTWTAREAFKQSQLAMLDDKQLTLVVTDTKKLGNQCYAYRTIYSN